MRMPSRSTTSILLLTMSLELGGAETHLVSLAKNLKARGWDVTVASAGGSLVQSLSLSGIPHFDAPLNSRSPLNMAKAAGTVKHLVRTREVGLVHAHARIPAWISEGIARRAGVPMVVTYHGTFVSGPFWNYFTRPGDRTIAISPDIKDYIVREFGFDPERITVIPNGIDLDVFAPASPAERLEARASFGVGGSQGPVIVYASRIEHDLTEVTKKVARAAEILQPKYPDLALLIAGDGDGVAELGKVVAESQRQHGQRNRALSGIREGYARAYAAADVVVGMSRVALEASACERPCHNRGAGRAVWTHHSRYGPVLEECNFTTRGAPSPFRRTPLRPKSTLFWLTAKRERVLPRFAREIVASKHSMERVTLETEKVYRGYGQKKLESRNPFSPHSSITIETISNGGPNIAYFDGISRFVP